jgi:STE24 endopeptidase
VLEIIAEEFSDSTIMAITKPDTPKGRAYKLLPCETKVKALELGFDVATPENLKDVYDAETYEKWKKYSAEHSRLEIVSTCVSCVITVVLLSTNVYSAFASLFGTSAFLQLLAVLLIETMVDAVIGTAISYVSTMVIEQKYGLNRSTIKTFVIDRIRNLLIGLGFSLLLAELMLLFHGWLGAWMIPLFTVVVFGFTVLINFLYPILSRVGNKFTPLEDGELKDALMALLTKHGYQVKAIEVMDASRRTTKLNAYFTGFGKLKTIVLFDNLVNAMSPEEICAVFAHELGHGLNKDIPKRFGLSFVNFLLMGTLAWGVCSIPAIHEAFGFTELNYGFAYLVMSVGLGILQPLIGLVTNAQSRRAEYLADRQAVIEGYGPEMISAFKKLAKDNFSHLSPSKINVVLEYSHPPLDRRVEEVEKAMAELDKAGK